MSARDGASTVGPAFLLTLGPLLGTLPVRVCLWAFAVPDAISWPLALGLGWCLGVFATVQQLKRHWAGFSVQPTWSLLCASGSALVTMFAVAWLAAPWSEFLSAQDPTPIMVVQDAFANFGPVCIGTMSAWVVLTLAQRSRSEV